VIIEHPSLAQERAAEPALEFHPLINEWFRKRFGRPTEPQRLGWPHIAAGRNTLIAAPTGSGKTLTAFLSCIDRLFRRAIVGELTDQTEVVYISPLKALSNDIRRNLSGPLEEIRALAAAAGHEPQEIRALVRTGDTPGSERQKMIRRPPHILVTTPESLYLLLTSQRGRELMRSVKTVIVDEIHALARDKRGSHLTLTLERLAALCPTPPVRIGLSATQRPMDQIARFLVGSPLAPREEMSPGASQDQESSQTLRGSHHAERDDYRVQNVDASGQPECAIIDVGHLRQLDLDLDVPASELNAVCTNEQWAEVYTRLVEMIQTHRSTLVFVNTRRLAERITHHLSELLDEEVVASHHGSLSREIRQSAEERLKAGKLKAIVATASLEMGIDIGYIDLVCQIGSPRAIATFLQRIGRSGHSLGMIPKGRLFPLCRDELLECLSLLNAVRAQRLDQVEIPHMPLDILAQQIVAATANEEWQEDELFNLFRRAWPYRDLKRESFDRLLEMLCEGVARNGRHGAYLHRDRINGRVKARRGARIAAITSGGAIPETADYRVFTEGDHTYVGTVNEDFAIESMAGDIFLLGNTSWRIHSVRSGEMIVSDAHGAPATIPFWLGEAPGRTVELSAEVSRLREEVARRVKLQGVGAGLAKPQAAEEEGPCQADLSQAVEWLRQECGVGPWAAEQSARYVAAQKAALGLVPTRKQIVFERFFDESGGMQLVVHSPLGARINRAWGLALRKRFCRSFDFELQAAADDDGIVLSLGPQHSFPIDALFKMLNTGNGEYLLKQALLAAPMFLTRWRWNATRALAVLRQQGGKRVPPPLQRMRAEDLLASVFPQTVGCLENHHGDIEIPDHPLVEQTVLDCLHEAMDLDRWLALLGQIERGEIELVARDTREPSPFSHKLLNANPYAFLDDAPLEERRARAVATRRTLSIESVQDLGRLDADAIRQVRADAWPVVRDADELHDALMSLGALPAADGAAWQPWFEELVRAGRAARCSPHAPREEMRAGLSPNPEPRPGPRGFPHAERDDYWIAAERLPLVRALWPDATIEPEITLPESLRREWESADARVALVRGRLQVSGPITAATMAAELNLEVGAVDAALVALEGEGVAMRGHFTPPEPATNGNGAALEIEWCERRLLARIHRLTLDGLRRRIEPVEVPDYLRFLVRHQRLVPDLKWRGQAGVREAVAQLQGYEAAAAAWERSLLPSRVRQYDPAWLDQLSMLGELTWGRLRPPRKSEEDGPSTAQITRACPIALCFRQDLGWLISTEPRTDRSFVRSNAQLVLETLEQRGALFPHELVALTQLMPTHVAEALHELAALGLVTADAFAAVRSFVDSSTRQREDRRRKRAGRKSSGANMASGRWTLFPGIIEAPSESDRLQRWAWQLLERWGVVFRDLLAREPAAPSWGQLVGVYRRLEARGEIRGGRFVTGVAGEQYATSKAVELLRQVRDEPASGQWIVISASDPLNLCGILTDGPRVPATHVNALALRDGRYVATQQAGEIQFHTELPQELSVDMTRKLRRTG
jgi:ATP-dependent Lhr-like helicase